MAIRSSFYHQWVRPLLAEFLGQLMFTFTHCSVVVGWEENYKEANNTYLVIALANGIILTLAKLVAGPISGGHINSSITASLALMGVLPVVMVPLYWIAQLAGSVAGAAISMGMYNTAGGAFFVGAGYTVWQGLLCEVVLTFMLHLVALMTGIEWKLKSSSAFAAGLMVTTGICAGFFVSGASMNPSLTFGPAVMSGQWDDYWIYWVGPIAGGLSAAMVIRLLLSDKRLILLPQKEEDVV